MEEARAAQTTGQTESDEMAAAGTIEEDRKAKGKTGKGEETEREVKKGQKQPTCFKKRPGAGELSAWLRALDVPTPPEDLGSSPSTHTVACNCLLTLATGNLGIKCLLLPPAISYRYQIHM